MRENGISISGQKKTYTVQGSSNEITTEYLDRRDLNIEIGIGAYGGDYTDNDGEYAVTLTWDWSGEDLDDWGEPPRDIVGLHWVGDDWTVANAEHKSTNHTYYKKHSGKHIDYQFNDSLGDGSDVHYFVTNLEPTGDSDPDDREVGGGYIHTYDGVKIESVTAGFPAGLSATLSNNNKKWNTSTDSDSDALIVSQSDGHA
ncbi:MULTISPECIES: hypothetical protein [Halomicrobium]|uniref:Uncharacterized protein n=1 Tax=Halomicrobium mukohataei TaxID=57705 RepID=A0A4D6KEA7_9EURY|nr:MULTISPECIES: hypothetical protein [Halomicrobium]QCD65199.1 hypothetical protein E5139_05915 [Halomicrobium mukohataei]QFR20005.1 hypothetical protein GBQ70_05910 [Halomicrobium sp. ZPS1]